MTDDSNDSWIYVKLVFLYLASKVTYTYHDMAGNVLVTLSILYVLLKLWGEYKKSRVK